MVARTQRADLSRPALFGVLAHLVRIGAGHAAALFGMRDILGTGEALAQRPPAAVVQDPVELRLVDVQMALDADAAGEKLVERVRQLVQIRQDILHVQLRAHHADAAVDVVAHAAGGDHAIGQTGGDYAADREAVALVNVRHRHRLPDDSGQRGRVDQLLQRAIF